MRTVHRKTVAAAGLSALAIFGAVSCSNDRSSEATSTSSAAMETTTSAAPASPSTTAMADPAANLVGTGCAAYAEQVPSGPGSVAGMAQDPVAVAASNNPMLKTLTQALSGQLNPQVNLVDTLNSNPALTVFAPTDDAFAKIDAATLEKLKTDSELLTSILTYHVVEGQASPNAVAGDHKTLEGGSVTVTGSGPDLKVNDAGLVCGGVQTANATVYMIDTVLMPPAS
ncbi:secreted/surface protein with fasciclin-like repeats [Mycolicibacterium rhodesiae NBB3]|uniref:Secreted/surface protein with fasciclin-like repeats n=1 Tax=Mycolicibacterium rhodesiae (strain NBB3) TaxID=710685 RepID=G8RM24_MYCRN|nr:fasciclin domain-containing protein [Mycolicibacterium rhodesiae]AEV76186.1 secreted/surface protein with fasciclin-like repeats [Mycolicibacterium rhodesiae NBB3]